MYLIPVLKDIRENNSNDGDLIEKAIGKSWFFVASHSIRF